jgi:HPt (histidine-containing phosphotransfer) domain-containing protein
LCHAVDTIGPEKPIMASQLLPAPAALRPTAPPALPVSWNAATETEDAIAAACDPSRTAAPDAENTGKGGPFDLAELRQRCTHDESLVGKILVKFREKSVADLAALRRAITAHDDHTAAHLAHAIKAAGANLASSRVRRAAARLEQCCRRGGGPEAFADLADLYSEVSYCLAWIEELRRTCREEWGCGSAAPAGQSECAGLSAGG